MKKIKCIFYDDDVNLEQRVVGSWKRKLDQIYNKDYEGLSYDDFNFSFWDSKSKEYRPDELVEKWKNESVNFVVVDARALGDSESTEQAKQLLGLLKLKNLKHCVFTSSGNNLMLNNLPVFEDVDIFKKSHEQLTDEAINKYSFNGNFYDMLIHIKNSPYEFYEILEYIKRHDNKHNFEEFKKNFFKIDEIFQSLQNVNFYDIKPRNFEGFHEYLRIINECLLKTLIDCNIIPNGISFNSTGSFNATHSIKFLQNPSNRSVYSYFNNDLKEKKFIYENNFIDLELEADIDNKRWKVKKIKDNSKNVLMNSDIGEDLSKSGIGDLFWFISGYANKTLHSSGINNTLDFDLSALFACRTLLKRLIKLFKANEMFNWKNSSKKYN